MAAESVAVCLDLNQGNDQEMTKSNGDAGDFGTKGGEFGNLSIEAMIAEERRGQKRRMEGEDDEMVSVGTGTAGNGSSNSLVEKGQRRRKKRKQFATQQPKNALMQLNEFKPGLDFVLVSQEGPPHASTFVMTVSVDGQIFEGRGASKQKAKHDAAEKALRSFIQLPFQIETNSARRTEHADFTKDTTCGADADSTPFIAYPDQVKTAANVTINKETIDMSKNPVQLLNELHKGQLDYQLEEDPNQRNPFSCTVEVNGQTYTGSGSSKKKAKLVAASKALYAMYGISGLPSGPLPSVNSTGATMATAPPEESQLPLHIADHIAQLTLDKFTELTWLLGDQGFRRKVLAGIVMTTTKDNGELEYQMISLGTGTKFIGGEYISEKGYAVNDCHGEIIARRGLRRFIYSQLEAYTRGETDSSILEKKPSGLFGLKSGIDFHLYISTSPCGDARVFSPHEGGPDEIDNHAGRKKRGLLRVKIENGEGMFLMVKIICFLFELKNDLISW